jgi:hypothetical protein
LRSGLGPRFRLRLNGPLVGALTVLSPVASSFVEKRALVMSGRFILLKKQNLRRSDVLFRNRWNRLYDQARQLDLNCAKPSYIGGVC